VRVPAFKPWSQFVEVLVSDPCGIISLITDFGMQDGYVGAMRGVILGINPGAHIVDISHGVARHDLLHAALILQNTCGYFPPGSVHLVVVDPGVGSGRRPLMAETENFFLVGPDNGVLSPALETFPPIRVVVIENPRYLLPHISDTFHGRDIFAPAAAHCALGVPVEKFGSETRAYQSMELPQPKVLQDSLRGQVIAVDGFGNLVTNISRHLLKEHVGTAPCTIHIGKTTITEISRSYQEVPQGSPLVIIGSWDLMEIAVNGGDAHSELGAGHGATVVVRGAARG
jgi:S-adenosylmethionine hydrolase